MSIYAANLYYLKAFLCIHEMQKEDLTKEAYTKGLNFLYNEAKALLRDFANEKGIDDTTESARRAALGKLIIANPIHGGSANEIKGLIQAVLPEPADIFTGGDMDKELAEYAGKLKEQIAPPIKASKNPPKKIQIAEKLAAILTAGDTLGKTIAYCEMKAFMEKQPSYSLSFLGQTEDVPKGFDELDNMLYKMSTNDFSNIDKESEKASIKKKTAALV